MMSSDPIKAHFDDVRKRVQCQSVDPALKESAKSFFNRTIITVSYNFTWLAGSLFSIPKTLLHFRKL